MTPRGTSWALSVGRFGAVPGGGLLNSLHLSLQHLFLVATTPFILGTVVSLVLQRMYADRVAVEGEPRRPARLEAALPPGG